MARAFLVARRSIDPRTKQGCVVVDEDNTVLSCGYNGPPSGCVDEAIPLNPPDKYDWIKHAEENAILNAAKVGTALKGSTFYVTGHPCAHCFSRMVNVKAERIVYGPLPYHSLDENNLNIIDKIQNDHMRYGMEKKHSVKFVLYDRVEEIREVISGLTNVLDDIEKLKNGE